MDKSDVFSKESQLNARTGGKYDELARNVGKCVFCDLKDKYILTEKDGMVLTVNLFPYIDGQMLVIPRRHVENLDELTEKEIKTSILLSKKAIKVLRKELKVDGVWLVLRDGGLAGKTVRHLHWNIMPYVDGINTWHYQDITIAPIDLATKLRPVFAK